MPRPEGKALAKAAWTCSSENSNLKALQEGEGHGSPDYNIKIQRRVGGGPEED